MSNMCQVLYKHGQTSQKPCQFPVSQKKNLRLREVQQLTQGLTVVKQGFSRDAWALAPVACSSLSGSWGGGPTLEPVT